MRSWAKHRASIVSVLFISLVALSILRQYWSEDALWRVVWLFPVRLLELILGSMVVLWGGAPLLRQAKAQWATGTMPTLVALLAAALVTYSMALVLVFFPTAVPPSFAASPVAAALFQPAAAMVTFALLCTRLRDRATIGILPKEHAWLFSAAFLKPMLNPILKAVTEQAGFTALALGGFAAIAWLLLAPQSALDTAYEWAFSAVALVNPLAWELARLGPFAHALRRSQYRVAQASGIGLAPLLVVSKAQAVVFGRSALTDEATALEGARASVCAVSVPGQDQDRLIALAAALMRAAEHPLAKPVLASAEKLKRPVAVASHLARNDHRLEAEVAGQHVTLGNLEVLGASLEAQALISRAHDLRLQGFTVFYLALSNVPAGLLGVRETVSNTAKSQIQSLRNAGLHPILVLSENRTTAAAISAELGLDPTTELVSDLAPTEALVMARELAGQNAHVVSALGISTANHSDIGALDLGTLEWLALEAQRAKAQARRGERLVTGYNALAILLGSGLLYSLTGIVLSPMTGTFASALFMLLIYFYSGLSQHASKH